MSGEEESSKRRRVARACDACRRKKVRCDGVQPGSDPPSCTNCKVYKQECSYIDAPKKRGPPKGYIEALETRLQRMESVLGNLVQSGNLPESVINSNLEWININESSFRDNTADSPNSDLCLTKSRNSPNGHDSDSDESLSGESNNYDLNNSMGSLAIDDSGHTKYIGHSSGIFLIKKFATSILQQEGLVRQDLSNYLSKRPKQNIDVSSYASKELCDKLLDTYWREIHSFMPFIDKEDFMEKYNKLDENPSLNVLLFAMFAVASRFLHIPEVYKDPKDPSSAGDTFAELVRDLLKDEFDNATIPNIQALILLAGHQQGEKNSNTWLYHGLAIRLAQDMGLHRDVSKWNLHGLDARQIEIRKRVWWACVLSDRLVSAALGRPLAISESDCDVDLPIYGLIPGDPPFEAWTETIKIGLILGRVLSHVYSIKTRHSANVSNGPCLLSALDGELTEWREKLPKELQFDYSNLSIVLSDPINKKKLFVHLVYYTTQILLHRPHIRSPKSKTPSSIPSLTICTKAANHISHIMYRLMKEGMLQRSWPTLIYFFFTAATMHLINALSGDDRFKEVAKHGLRMVLKCLDYLKPYWYAADKCSNLMSRLLKSRNINLDGAYDDNVSNGKHTSKKRRSAYQPTMACSEAEHFFKPSILNEIPHTNLTSPHTPSTPPSVPSQINATPTSIQEYSAAMRQHVVNRVSSTIDEAQPTSYEQTSSPGSENSASSFTFNDFSMNVDNELFLQNIDSFIPEVSSLLYNDNENIPFLPVDFNNLNDLENYMMGLQPSNMNDHIFSNSLDFSPNSVVETSTNRLG
ncbi:11239_t:CDS:2 [Dentiscutata erythropus]|uniref:11239_t:CDS:1 n=1 Tax=Dentiscutata erythropus TaxID=1348616 RepID=A0A9N9B5W4_9GLOM|nr:11239_t:CDS:2 [Dentiscutata erythropus]